MQLTKHHGLANDFLVTLDEVNGPELATTPDDAVRLCDRRTGIGADGLIHGQAPDPNNPDHQGIDVVMVLFNADGSRAEMSGNGIRCLAQALAAAREAVDVTFHILTDAGVRVAEVRQDADDRQATVSVTMGEARPGPVVPTPLAEAIDGRFDTVDVGNPHLVVLVDEPSTIDLASEGAWLESQFPDGVNVEFIAVTDTDVLELAVWERGAGITQACGTGACASAHVAHRWGLVGDRVRVDMPGGSAEVLLPSDVTAAELAPGALEPSHEITLIGPAQHVGTIEVA